jgi:hypothetical protein
MTLNKNNYFTKENTYISNSRIKDYLTDPYYYYRKHVLGEVKDIESQPLRLGQAVDMWLTEGKKVFEKNYIAVTRRNLKNPPTTHTELPNGEYNMVVKLCERVESQDAYKVLKDYKKQIILSQDIKDLKNHKGICGIPDFFQVFNDIAIIVDLKTSITIDPYKYNFRCLDLGYYNQMAMYSKLIKHKYPEVKQVECRHLVVHKDPLEIYKTQVFILDAERIALIEDNIDSIVQEIDSNKEWRGTNVSWDDAINIGQISENLTIE